MKINYRIDYTTMNLAKDLNLNPIFCALNGGEDYELLFTISQDHYDKLKKDVDFTIIGHVTDKKEGNNFITKDSTSHPITRDGLRVKRTNKSEHGIQN